MCFSDHSTGYKLLKNATAEIEKGRARKGSGKLREAVNVIHVKDLVARYTWKEHFFTLSTPLQSTNLPQNLHGTVQTILQFKKCFLGRTVACNDGTCEY
jgi:hypothetical protein